MMERATAPSFSVGETMSGWVRSHPGTVGCEQASSHHCTYRQRFASLREAGMEGLGVVLQQAAEWKGPNCFSLVSEDL